MLLLWYTSCQWFIMNPFMDYQILDIIMVSSLKIKYEININWFEIVYSH